VAGGAGQIRVVGDVPHPGVGTPWHSWARYEMAINALYDQYPVWGMCPYDLRTTPDDVLELVASVHPHVAHDDGRHVDGPALGPLEEMSARLPAPVPYPIEHTDPAVRIEAPELRVARSAASQLGAAAGLSPADRGDLCVAVSEVLSNAQQHGVPPVQLRGWSEPGRVVIAVTDRGGGPGDPLCGLSSLGRPLGAGGLGMWVAHQMCADVTMHRDDHGFTVRLVAGDPRLS
jgi:anti-sigma regulatory factor (Ser/Thr protein kinase)